MDIISIFTFLVFVILAAISAGLYLSNKSKIQEDFLVRLDPPSIKRKCIDRGQERIMEPIRNKPQCFFYDIDKNTEDLMGIFGDVKDRTDDILRRGIRVDDELTTRALDGSKTLDIILKGEELAKFSQNIRTANTNTTNNEVKIGSVIAKLSPKNVSANESAIMNDIRNKVSQFVANSINDIVKTTSGDIKNTIVRRIKENNVDETIIQAATNLIHKKISMSGNADINNAINQYIESKQLDKIISQSIQNIMLDDPTFSEYMRNNGKKNVKIGDFVYFKHKIDTDAPDICADNESQREIIVGGKVCGINPINNSVKVSYSYVMNPNYNKRCASIGAANYDRGVAGLPKWYAGAGSDVSKVCGPGPEKNMACKPSQWSRDGNTDNWVRKYIGGFDISKDEMSCGIGPSYYNLPQTVPIMALSKSLDDVVSSCAANLTADKPELEPLPRPKYNPQASQFLPVPKRVPTPPKPKKEFKVGGQSWTSDVDGVGFQSRGDVDLSKLSELGKKTAEQLAKDQSQIGRTGPTEGPDVIKQRGPRQEIQRVQIERPVQQKEKVRNDTLLENRCVNAEKDNNNPNRYIQNKTGKKFFIKNGMVFQEDKQLKLPNNVPVKYIYKKQSKDTILAYGSDNNWYQFKLFENPDGSTKQEFRKVDQTSLTEDYDGEIDPSGQCIPGNKV